MTHTSFKSQIFNQGCFKMQYKLKKKYNQFTEKTSYILSHTKIWNFENQLNPEIKYLNISDNQRLIDIKISSQNLEGLNINQNTSLKNITLNCPNLKNLIIRGNNLKSISIDDQNLSLNKLVIDEDFLEKLFVKVDRLKKIRIYTDENCLINPVIKFSNSEDVDISELPYGTIFYKPSQTYNLFLKYNAEPKIIQESQILDKLF